MILLSVRSALNMVSNYTGLIFVQLYVWKVNHTLAIVHNFSSSALSTGFFVLACSKIGVGSHGDFLIHQQQDLLMGS